MPHSRLMIATVTVALITACTDGTTGVMPEMTAEQTLGPATFGSQSDPLFKIDCDKTAIDVGETAKCDAMHADSETPIWWDASAFSSWWTDDPAIASVDDSQENGGLVTGTGHGTTVVRATHIHHNLETGESHTHEAAEWIEVTDPLGINILGPTTISQDGSYVWEANANGGVGDYTYKWYQRDRCELYWSEVGTGSSYSTFVLARGYDFTLRVDVWSGDQNTSTSLHVDRNDDGLECPQ